MRTHHKFGLVVALALGAVACSKSKAAPATSASAAAPTPPAAASSASAAAAKPAAPAEVKTTGLTPTAVKKNFSALMGKEVSGEAVMYHYEAAKLNGQQQYNAYIADDAKKTSSIQCSLSAPTKIKPNSKVTFKGTLRNATWIDHCEIAAAK